MALGRDSPDVFQDAGTSRAVASEASRPSVAGLEQMALISVCALCVVMQAFIMRRGAVRHGGDSHHAFQRLRTRYNVVYAFGTFGDWIQGAYLYALYREHGFDMADIGYIFVLGYFASATLGTWVASLGDVHGHRRLVMLYGVSYGVACLTMRYRNIYILLISRVLSGVSYSLLFSSFESWAIAETDRVGIHRKYLVQLFATATFFNAATAVVAGVVGNFVIAVAGVDGWPDVGTNGGNGDAHGSRHAQNHARPNRYTPAFDVGACSLFMCALGARVLWSPSESARSPVEGGVVAQNSETNKSLVDGEKTDSPKNANQRGVRRAAAMVWRDPGLRNLGVMNSLYEAALHVFVFVWTPALERRFDLGKGTFHGGNGEFSSPGATPASAVPHGLVFSLFMACKMAGSQLYQLLGDAVVPQRTLRVVFLVSAVSFAVPLFVSTDGYGSALFSFCLFEFGLGGYWPAMAVARAELVPNHLRSTMTSVFRIPLNVLVMACLAFAGNAGETSFLAMCFFMMTACFAFSGKKEKPPPPGLDLPTEGEGTLEIREDAGV